MDWELVIERNRGALRRILAALVAMAGLGCAGALSSPLREVEADRPTLPRHLHRAILRLLRPAEAAARRLIVVAARDVVVELPPLHPRKSRPGPDPKAGHAALRRLGIAVVVPSGAALPLPRPARGQARRGEAAIDPRRDPKRRRPPAFSLFDPLRRTGARRRTVAPHAAPRILTFDGAAPHRLPPRPSRQDPIDATRLGLRLAALAGVLDDLPAQARRLARWKSRVAAAAQSREIRDQALQQSRRHRRVSPLRLGRPPGQRSARSRRPGHEVHEILADLHWFAREALAQPDTS